MKLFNKYLIFILLPLIVLSSILVVIFLAPKSFNKEAINVGILFPLTGTLAGSAQPVVNATLLAIDEINQNGGIRGRKINPYVYSSANLKLNEVYVNDMIFNKHVSVIFGCWTSSCRKTIKPIIEKNKNLLIYPTQYEGIEQSKNIIYLGSLPNQQLIPAVSWSIQHGARKFYIVGSDYIYPRVANEILAQEISNQDGEVLNTQYFPLGSTDVTSVVKDIVAKKPQIIFNTINGDTNIAFFQELKKQTQNGARPLVISTSMAESDINKIGKENLIGDIFSWTYYSELQNPANEKFLKAYKLKYGNIDNINETAVNAYAGVYLWKQAAERLTILSPSYTGSMIIRASIGSPGGIIYVDPRTQNAWRSIILTQVNKKGQYQTLWTSSQPIEPIIYPAFKTKAQWYLFEYNLFVQWGNSWANPK